MTVIGTDAVATVLAADVATVTAYDPADGTVATAKLNETEDTPSAASAVVNTIVDEEDRYEATTVVEPKLLNDTVGEASMLEPKEVSTVVIVPPIGKLVGLENPTVTNDVVEPAMALESEAVTDWTPPISSELPETTAVEIDVATDTTYEPATGLAATGIVTVSAAAAVVSALIVVMVNTFVAELHSFVCEKPDGKPTKPSVGEETTATPKPAKVMEMVPPAGMLAESVKETVTILAAPTVAVLMVAVTAEIVPVTESTVVIVALALLTPRVTTYSSDTAEFEATGTEKVIVVPASMAASAVVTVSVFVLDAHPAVAEVEPKPASFVTTGASTMVGLQDATATVMMDPAGRLAPLTNVTVRTVSAAAAIALLSVVVTLASTPLSVRTPAASFEAGSVDE